MNKILNLWCALAGLLASFMAMIASGAIGTWVGTKLLKKMPAEKFKLIFRVLLSVMCLQLIWQAVKELM